MLLVKIKLFLMCDSKVLLAYLNLADVPTYQNVHVLYFHIIDQDLCVPHTFNLTIIILLCGGDCDCDPCGNYNSFLKEKYVIC